MLTQYSASTCKVGVVGFPYTIKLAFTVLLPTSVPGYPHTSKVMFVSPCGNALAGIVTLLTSVPPSNTNVPTTSLYLSCMSVVHVMLIALLSNCATPFGSNAVICGLGGATTTNVPVRSTRPSADPSYG